MPWAPVVVKQAPQARWPSRERVPFQGEFPQNERTAHSVVDDPWLDEDPPLGEKQGESSGGRWLDVADQGVGAGPTAGLVGTRTST